MAKNKREKIHFNFKILLTVLLIVTMPLLVFAVKNVSTQTSSHAMDNYPYYFSQHNSKWQRSTCDIQSYGCYPASLAMALKKFGLSGIDPLTVARDIGRGCKNGTNTYEANQAMRYVMEKGLHIYNVTGSKYSDIVVNGGKSFNYERAKDVIDSGGVILLGGCMKYFRTNNTLKDTPGLHAVLVINVNPNTHILTILDPTKEWGPRYFNGDDDIMNGCSNGNNGYYFAYSIARPE